MAFANTTFATGIKDSLAVIDTYNKENSDIVNIRPNTEDAFGQDNKYAFKLPNSGVGLKILSANQTTGLKVNSDSLISGILSSSNGVLSAFKQLPSPLQTSILSTNGLSQIQTQLNGVNNLVTNSDLNSIQGITTLIKGVSGGNYPLVVKDTSGLSSLSTNIIKEATTLGLSGVYTTFVSSLGDSVISKQITRKLIPYVLANSKFKLLKEIADGPYAKDVKKYNPKIANDAASAFRISEYKKQKDYNQQLIDIDYSLNKISPNWKTKQIGLNVTVDASSMSNASLDMKTLLKANSVGMRIPASNLNAPIVDTSSQLTDLNKISAIVNMSALSAQQGSDLFITADEALKNSFPTIA